jgi:hypothetical protein
VEVERYEEQVFTETRGNLRVRLRFKDNSLLEVSESVRVVNKIPERISYRHHYQDSVGNLIFRYDNAPHHPETQTHPHHKHLPDKLLNASPSSVGAVLKEIQEHLGRDE